MRRWFLVGLFMCTVILVGTAQQPIADETETASEASVLPRAAIAIEGGPNAGPRIQSLAATIRSTLEFSLSLSRAVELVENPDDAEFLFEIDIVEDDGQIELNAARVSLIDQSSEDLSQRTADSIFDVFSVADELSLDIVRTISNTDVSFGTIVLENRGVAATYGVRVDGVHVGNDQTRIDRVLTGERTVTITGTAENGTFTYHETSVRVSQDEPARVTFQLPPVAPSVVQDIRDWHRSVRSSLTGENTGSVPPPLEVILDGTPGVSGTSDRKAELSGLFRGFDEQVGSPSRIPVERVEQLRHAGILTERSGRSLPPQPDSLPEQRILPEIQPVPESDLAGWHLRIVGNVATPPIAVDPSGDSQSDRSGTDFHEVYAFRSAEGIHVIVTFHDGEAKPSNGRYRIGFATETPRGGLTEVVWRNESGRPEAVVARVNPQRWNRLQSFPAPTEYLDNALVFTIPVAAIEFAETRAMGNGWEFDAVLEEAIDGEYRTNDDIRLRERRIFF